MLAYQDLMDYSGRLMRNAIRALPDGDCAAETTIDGFPDDEEAKRRDLKIKATLKVRGDEITVDLTGTAPQVDDRPINMPLEGIVDCAIWLTLRSILLDSAVYGNVPQNMGWRVRPTLSRRREPLRTPTSQRESSRVSVRAMRSLTRS
jgi:N-methylhydantoinase B